MTNEPPDSHADGQQPTIERGGLWGLFFSAAGLLLPPFGVVFSALGVFQGGRARRAARQNNGQAPGALLSMVLGWAGIVVSIFAIVGYSVFWTEYNAYHQCSTRAHTEASQTQCDDAFRTAVSERTGIPKENVPTLNADS
ncbi:MAG: DUF4190 domain-containing protein [Nocardiopsaceae bacterium]|nr:DUF4190 domain-containing protein [Nocardiopsaceae bacterium]